MKNIKTSIFTLLALLVPSVGFAQTPIPKADGTFDGFMLQLLAILDNIVLLIMGLGLIVFLWGVFSYVVKGGDEKEKSKSKSYIVWGLIGLFVMISVWSIINLFTGTFFGNIAPGPSALPKL